MSLLRLLHQQYVQKIDDCSLSNCQAELVDFIEFNQEVKDRQFDLDWAGVHDVKYVVRHIGDRDCDIALFVHHGQQLQAFVKYAKRGALAKHYDEANYQADCRYDKVPDDVTYDYCLGTLTLKDALSRIYQRGREISKMQLHTEGSSFVRPPPPDRVAIPDTIEWVHATNSLLGPVHYDPLPELNDPWKAIFELVRTSTTLHFNKPPKRKCPASSPCDHTVLHHPRYGVFGEADNPLKREFRAFMTPSSKTLSRPPTHSVMIGSHIPAILPRWNRRDPYTTLAGAINRIGRDPVKLDAFDRQSMINSIEVAVDFVIQQIQALGLERQNITPEMSLRWLASSRFPYNKKRAYLKAFCRVIEGDSFIDAADFSNKHQAFPKNESYLEATKAQRLILAGDLEMAAVLAPACAILGNYFFSLPWTSKKIPETLRPRQAVNRFPGRVILNDMSAFEGSIDGEIKEMIEHKILSYFFPNIRPWLQRCNEPLDIWCNDCFIHAPTMRCSGDPQTSLGNSLVNLVTILAAMWRQDVDMNDVICWVEGDDSIVSCPANWDENNIRQHEEYFRKMGFSTKMELYDFVGDAGYCSMYFDHDFNMMPRVAQTFLDFPLDNSGFLNRGKELLSLKAYSLHSINPTQPLVWALERYYSPRSEYVARVPFNAYQMEEYELAGYDVHLDADHMLVTLPTIKLGDFPSDDERRLFADRYHIEPAKQIKLEKSILRHGVRGLILNSKNHVNHHYIRQICQIDGIDYEQCRNFYNYCKKDHFNDHSPVQFKVKSINGQVSMTPTRHLPSLRSEPIKEPQLVSRVINPISYRRKKMKRIRRSTHRVLAEDYHAFGPFKWLVIVRWYLLEAYRLWLRWLAPVLISLLVLLACMFSLFSIQYARFVHRYYEDQECISSSIEPVNNLILSVQEKLVHHDDPLAVFHAVGTWRLPWYANFLARIMRAFDVLWSCFSFLRAQLADIVEGLRPRLSLMRFRVVSAVCDTLIRLLDFLIPEHPRHSRHIVPYTPPSPTVWRRIYLAVASILGSRASAPKSLEPLREWPETFSPPQCGHEPFWWALRSWVYENDIQPTCPARFIVETTRAPQTLISSVRTVLPVSGVYTVKEKMSNSSEDQSWLDRVLAWFPRRTRMAPYPLTPSLIERVVIYIKQLRQGYLEARYQGPVFKPGIAA